MTTSPPRPVGAPYAEPISTAGHRRRARRTCRRRPVPAVHGPHRPTRRCLESDHVCAVALQGRPPRRRLPTAQPTLPHPRHRQPGRRPRRPDPPPTPPTLIPNSGACLACWCSSCRRRGAGRRRPRGAGVRIWDSRASCLPNHASVRPSSMSPRRLGLGQVVGSHPPALRPLSGELRFWMSGCDLVHCTWGCEQETTYHLVRFLASTAPYEANRV